MTFTPFLTLSLISNTPFITRHTPHYETLCFVSYVLYIILFHSSRKKFYYSSLLHSYGLFSVSHENLSVGIKLLQKSPERKHFCFLSGLLFSFFKHLIWNTGFSFRCLLRTKPWKGYQRLPSSLPVPVLRWLPPAKPYVLQDLSPP